MEFRDLKRQYEKLKPELDRAIGESCRRADFIHGSEVITLEEKLADYVGVKHCITCANGTDALQLALMCWDIHQGDAVFVPDFTFFSTGEAPAILGATPIFVDVDRDTFNMSPDALKAAIETVITDGVLNPKAIISVDLFGQPAEYPKIRAIADEYKLLLLEDGAQGFGGCIGKRKACSFGDISTTSFFPAKPLGCYGDGGAIFTDHDEWAKIIRSLCVHGKGKDKYDNIRLGMNSRLDTLQAAILGVKLNAFIQEELTEVNKIADRYDNGLAGQAKTPFVKNGYMSSWAQYTLQLENRFVRDKMVDILKTYHIPTMIYYAKPLHKQKAFENCKDININKKLGFENTDKVCETVLSLPIFPYMAVEEQHMVIKKINEALIKIKNDRENT